MRKIAAAILAVPVLGILYVPVLLRRSIAARVGLAVGVGALLGIAALASLPARSEARPPSRIVPVAQASFAGQVQFGRAVTQPIVIGFSQPMDRASVAAALTVVPAAHVVLEWAADGRTLTVAPASAWKAGTYYVVTIGVAAHDRAGTPLGSPVRAIFLTRSATLGHIAAVEQVGDRVAAGTSFRLTFDRPVDLGSLRAALTIVPSIQGALVGDEPGSASASFTFTPSAPLAPDTRYTLALTGLLLDAERQPVGAVEPLTVRTVAAASVIRFRPIAGTTSVAIDALISVRFTKPMVVATTSAAWRVTVAGKPVAGKVTWAENDTVLVFDPAANLPYATKVTATVAATARAQDGSALDGPHVATFTTVAKPAASPTRSSGGSTRVVPTGGGTIGGAPWGAVESYYLRLMNCTRTGGWVYSGGVCGRPPTNRSILPPAPAIYQDAGISSKVSRPYAKLIATAGVCDHFYGSTPLQRLTRAGYPSGWYGENIGCPYGNPYAGMVAVEIFFQNEPAYPSSGLNHYTNLMNRRFSRAGIGVWVYAGRVRVVIDFNP